jgi:hypothetical protein
MKMVLAILIISFSWKAAAQQGNNEPEHEINTNRFEDQAEAEESESENDYDLQQLKHLIKHPLDINGSDLDQLPLIDPLHIHNLIAYRRLMGDIIDLHELQAVPGFHIDLIRSILPYITVAKQKFSIPMMHQRITEGKHSIIVRPSYIPEMPDGFRTQQFTGSRAALFLRYKYEFRNLLQFGFVADKDPGEKFVNGRIFPDFVSFHLFTRNIGAVRSFALGDYTINLGQGLIHWQSQAFRKSSSVLNIKRQSEVVRPYQSAGEYNFLRGAAATFSFRSFESTLFLSRKNLTANKDSGVITSVITSGLHRTKGELNDKNNSSLFTYGGTVKSTFKSAQISLNGVGHLYSLPLMKKDEPYNRYAISGRQWFNIGADYSYTFRNFHFFGEVAVGKSWSIAYVNGMMASLSPGVDIAAIYRRIDKQYQSVFGNAFSENTMPANESGCYTGVSIRPHIKWKIDLYADLFSFPWLKYRLDAPATGFAYLFQLTWKPSRKTELYSRLRYRLKPLNIENEEEDVSMPGIQIIQHWRTHIGHQVSRTLFIRSRVELSSFSHRLLGAPAMGYLFYTDVVYKPYQYWLSGNLRFQAFEAENYDSRIYAYENDLLFVSSTPSFYNNGVRCYMNVRAKTKVKILSNSVLQVNMKLATTVYTNISHVGSGVGAIRGNRVSAVKLQFFLAE